MGHVRYLVYIGAAVGTATIGALNTCMNFAWVCMVNGSNETNVQASAYPLLNWGNHEQGVIFSSTGIGGLLMALPAGWLVNRFGSRVTLAVNICVSGTASLLIPTASQGNFLFVAVLWGFVGTSASLLFPIAFSICSWWSPKAELGKAFALSTCGVQIGRFVQLFASGVECRTIGWEWIFRISGIISIIFGGVWLVIYRDNPKDFAFITQAERDFIAESRQRQETEKPDKIPWVALLTCPAVLSCMICRFSNIIITRGVNQFIPTYNRDILIMQPELNGYMSSLPIASQLTARFAAGYLTDLPISSATIRMKVINSISFMGTAAFCLGLTGIREDIHYAVPTTLFCGVMFMATACTGGYMKCPLLIAPHLSAIIGSLMNLTGNVAAVILPYVVDGIVVTKSRQEWDIVFYIIGGVSLLGAFSFVVLGSGKEDVRFSGGQPTGVIEEGDNEGNLLQNDDTTREP